jgi:hypothetical protein
MAIIVDVDLDIDGAQSDLDALQDELANGLGKAAEKGGKEFERALEAHTRRAQKNMQTFGKQAGLDLKAAFRDLPGLIGDTGDAVEMLGKNFGMLNKEQAETLGNAAGLMEKFGQLGGQLGGPYGAAAGVALGATVALRNELIEAQKAARQMEAAVAALAGKLPDLAKEQEAARKEAEKHASAWAGITSKGGLATREGTVEQALALEEAQKRAADPLAAIKKDMEAAAEAAKKETKELIAFLDTVEGELARQAVDARLALEALTGPDMTAFNEWFLNANTQVENFSDEWINSFAMMQLSVQDLGVELQSALGDVGAGAAMALFDAMEEGQPILRSLGASFKQLAADALKGIGSELVGQGILDAAKGTGLLIRSAGIDPRGWALEAHGAAQIAGGLAMGGTGALIGRMGGGGGRGRGQDEAGGGGGGSLFGGSLSLGKGALGGGNTNNSTNNTYIIQALDVGDRELWERLGARVERGRRAFRKAGGKLLGGD